MRDRLTVEWRDKAMKEKGWKLAAYAACIFFVSALAGVGLVTGVKLAVLIGIW